MQIKNIQIFSSTAPANGSWVDVSNLVQLSVMLTGLEATVAIEASNDPNAPINGTGIGAPGSAPTLTQAPAGAAFQSGVSNLPGATYFVKVTFITPWGETTPSSESSLAVTAGNYLYVKAPVPSAAQLPYVTGYNVYVGTVTNTEVLQTAPAYTPQRLVDGIGTPGGTVNPLGPGQSTHFSITGALPIAQGFAMINGFQNTGITVPGSDNSGGAAVGVNISGTFTGAAWAAPAGGNSASQSQISINTTALSALWNPSGICFKYIRVTKITGNSTPTQAFLCGQNG